MGNVSLNVLEYVFKKGYELCIWHSMSELVILYVVII